MLLAKILIKNINKDVQYFLKDLMIYIILKIQLVLLRST